VAIEVPSLMSMLNLLLEMRDMFMTALISDMCIIVLALDKQMLECIAQR
jgi:hypothetical protein